MDTGRRAYSSKLLDFLLANELPADVPYRS
jgi:hypothetical protein